MSSTASLLGELREWATHAISIEIAHLQQLEDHPTREGEDYRLRQAVTVGQLTAYVEMLAAIDTAIAGDAIGSHALEEDAQ